MLKYISESAEGSYLKVCIQANSKTNEIVGLHGDELKIKISASAVENKANRELINFLSKFLKIPKRDVQICKGESSKHKTIFIKACFTDNLRQKLSI